MSNYITPDKVVSPRQHWRLIRVLQTGEQGDSNGDRVAIAIGTWDDDMRLAMRWNGDDDSPIGNPQSRGLPTWFMMPGRLNEAVINTLSPDDKILVRSLFKAPKK